MTDQIEQVARALAKADGLDFDEVCGVDADPDNGYCDSGTCVAAHWEEHDAEQARRWYIHLAKAAIAAMQQAQEPVAWRYTRADGHFFLTPKRCRYGYSAADGWSEEALYTGPTPPNGGSDEVR